MKILCLSDIHLDINSRILNIDLLPVLITYIKDIQPDLLLIAGDISDYYKTTLSIVRRIKEQTGVTVKFIPGNHDIWVQQEESSWTVYEVFRKNEDCLIDNPFFLDNDYVVVGDLGWYDYSLGVNDVSTNDYELIKKDLYRKDSLYALWNQSDAEMTHFFIEKLKRTLDKYTDEKVILLNHFVPWQVFSPYIKEEREWNLQNGFMGSDEMGKLIESHPSIKYTLFGHTHQKYGIQRRADVFVLCNPLGYVHEWNHSSFYEELKTCGLLIKI